MNYKTLLNMFDDYIELNIHKDYYFDDILHNFIDSNYELNDQIIILLKQLNSKKNDIQSLLSRIKKFNSIYIERASITQFEDEEYPEINDLLDETHLFYNGFNEYELEWMDSVDSVNE